MTVFGVLCRFSTRFLKWSVQKISQLIFAFEKKVNIFFLIIPSVENSTPLKCYRIRPLFWLNLTLRMRRILRFTLVLGLPNVCNIVYTRRHYRFPANSISNCRGRLLFFLCLGFMFIVGNARRRTFHRLRQAAFSRGRYLVIMHLRPASPGRRGSYNRLPAACQSPCATRGWIASRGWRVRVSTLLEDVFGIVEIIQVPARSNVSESYA